MPLVFLHSHLLDFSQPKTIIVLFSCLLNLICFGFLYMFVLSLLVLLCYYQCCIINGIWWLYNSQWAVLLIPNFDINIKNKLINLFLLF